MTATDFAILHAIEHKIASGGCTFSDWLAAINARCDVYLDAGEECPLVCPRCPLTECVRQLSKSPPPKLASFWWGRFARLVETCRPCPLWHLVAATSREPAIAPVVNLLVEMWGKTGQRSYRAHPRNLDGIYRDLFAASEVSPGVAVAKWLAMARVRPRSIEWLIRE